MQSKPSKTRIAPVNTEKHIEAIRNKTNIPVGDLKEQSHNFSLADDLKSHVIGQDAKLIRLPKLSAVIVLIGCSKPPYP